MTYIPFYGPNKNIIDLADKIIVEYSGDDPEKASNKINDVTGLYYSMKLISEIDKLYRFIFTCSSTVVQHEIKDHILKLQKALGLINNSKSIATYFSDITEDDKLVNNNPIIKLLNDYKNKGTPKVKAIALVAETAGVPELRVRQLIIDKGIEYPEIDTDSPEYNSGMKDGQEYYTTEDIVDGIIATTADGTHNTLVDKMLDQQKRYLTSDPTPYFGNNGWGACVARTDSKNFSSDESSDNFSWCDGIIDNNCSGTSANNAGSRLNNYVAGILASRNFSSSDLGLLKLNTEIVTFSRKVEDITKDLENGDLNETSKLVERLNKDDTAKLSSKITKYIEDTNIDKLLGNKISFKGTKLFI